MVDALPNRPTRGQARQPDAVFLEPSSWADCPQDSRLKQLSGELL